MQGCFFASLNYFQSLSSVKFIFTRTAFLALSGGMYDAVWRRSSAVESYIQVLKSIWAGVIHSIRRLCLSDISAVKSKFIKSISGESILAIIVDHFNVVRALNHCGARALIRRYPNYVNKYATNYLANSFSKTQRREILLYHHHYLTEKHITETFYENILEGGLLLWSETIHENQYSIRMSFIHEYHAEGDLSLIFSIGDRELYGISFSIVPGKMIGSNGGQALLIGNIQGRLGEAEPIRIATRACHDIAPPYLLVAAALSIADVLNIETIAGVGSEEHLMKLTNSGLRLYFDYNAFWETLLLKKNDANFYEGSVPLPDKPIALIKSKNRGRARRKRRFRWQVSRHIGTTFIKFVAKTSNCNELFGDG